jgi:hypothetical protein
MEHRTCLDALDRSFLANALLAYASVIQLVCCVCTPFLIFFAHLSWISCIHIFLACSEAPYILPPTTRISLQALNTQPKHEHKISYIAGCAIRKVSAAVHLSHTPPTQLRMTTANTNWSCFFLHTSLTEHQIPLTLWYVFLFRCQVLTGDCASCPPFSQ